ncbi:MAG: hypothetical protein L0154_26150 [Chloroflexi bacterium]|nr:hypothetical protein [Chloroflexota bacterium]
MPFALFGAFIFSTRFPRLRGVAFGLVLGFAAYLMTGFLFGDTVGLLVALIAFGWTIMNQHHIQISQRQFGNTIVFFDRGKPKRKEKGPPIIEILPPPD